MFSISQKVAQVLPLRRAGFLAALILILHGQAARSQQALGTLVNKVFEAAGNYAAFYGDGADGALSIPTGAWTGAYIGFPTKPLSVNTTRSYLTANAAAGATTLTIATGYTSATFDAATDAGFASCTSTCSASTHFQEILIIQMGGPTAGTYEFARLRTRAGATLTLDAALTKSYTAANKVQVIRVPRYTSVTFNSGGFLSVGKWDGNTGGIVAFRASGTVSLDTADASGTGRYVSRIAAGAWQDNPGDAGYGFAGGTNASPNAASALSPTASVATYDGQSLSPGTSDILMMGSGGRGTGGTGGPGGGLVIVKANAINIGGGITALGGNGSGAQGGSGGTIHISANTIGEFSAGSCKTAGVGNVRASGGTGASSGGAGRIFINYGPTLTQNCSGAGDPSGVTTVRPFIPK